MATDASVATTEIHQDGCGVLFNEESLEQRLQRTKFLYRKHVEVIDDLAPIVDAMVDDIVCCCVAVSTHAECTAAYPLSVTEDLALSFAT